MSRGKRILVFLMSVLAYAGICFAFRPLVERAARQEQIDKATEEFYVQVEASSEKQEENPVAIPYVQLKEAIEQYNSMLYETLQSGLSSKASYEESPIELAQYGLDNEMFGIIHIPALEVTLPLYLGANDENMANGAAVLGQTSIPIGSNNTNAVIAGHRGWNGYPYFLHLDELEVGDLVYIDNVWELLMYKVVDVQIISPDDIDAIKIQPDRDMIALLTCHPPNTGGKQRLVVFCERVTE